MYKPWYLRINWNITAPTLLLIAFGILMIYTATFRQSGFLVAGKQLIAFFVGLFSAAFVFILGYKKICTEHFTIKKFPIPIRLSYLFYGLSVFLLLFVRLKGHSAYGSQRWIGLGPFSFEPSEVAKLALILGLCTFFAEQEDPPDFLTFLKAGTLTIFPIFLVLIQPDMGTSILLASLFFFISFFAGVNPLYLASTLAVGIGGMFKVMKPYQWKRLLGFLHPFKHPTGSGWNLIQSLIAVGSGKLAGKGLFQGSQTALQFVPQHATDFIFTVIAEQLGWIGAFFMLVLYFFILWQGTKIVLETKDRLGKLLACGIVSMFLVHIFINIGMTIGIMPITGIPLPFISSAGTSLIVNLICIAILLDIDYERSSLIR